MAHWRNVSFSTTSASQEKIYFRYFASLLSTIHDTPLQLTEGNNLAVPTGQTNCPSRCSSNQLRPEPDVDAMKYDKM